MSFSLIATVLAWQYSLYSAGEKARSEFERQADYAVGLFEQQMQRYADLLNSGAGFVAGSEVVQPEEWQSFTDRLALDENYPAFGGVGIVFRVEPNKLEEFVSAQRVRRPEFTIRPAFDPLSNSNREYLLPLTLISPESLVDKVTGLDVAREERRRDAINRSIKAGTVQISAPIRPDGIEESGLVLISPIFSTARPATELQRQSTFIGAVVGVVITKNLAQGILEGGIRQVALKVSDDADVMYDELKAENEDFDSQPLMTSSRTVAFFGRNWRFDIHSTKAFRNAQNNMTSRLILAGGLIIDALLLLLFLHMSRANRQATAFGDMISAKYKLQSENLSQTNKMLESRNEQLESFSYLVSHDLKAPLRAIGYLTDCIEEDLEDESHNSAPTDVSDHVQRLRKQLTLSERLIKGVLQYSGLGSEDDSSIEELNVLALLQELRVTLTVDDAQLRLIGEFPTFNTFHTQLTQVFMNLVGNGFKYNPDAEQAVVTVAAEASLLNGYYRFSVSDNGPGIKPAYHEKIFEPFTTLQPKDQSMTSGVGLAIVKKHITQHGGNIDVSSEPGQGTCITFDWPHSVEVSAATRDEQDLRKAA